MMNDNLSPSGSGSGDLVSTGEAGVFNWVGKTGLSLKRGHINGTQNTLARVMPSKLGNGSYIQTF